MPKFSLLLFIGCLAAGLGAGPAQNLVGNGTLEARGSDGQPVGIASKGGVSYRFLGDPHRDLSSWGYALQSTKPGGEITCDVTGLDAKAGRWFRFSFRGLPQDGFFVGPDGLFMKVGFFGKGGTVAYDAKSKSIFPLVEAARRDLSVNGDRHRRGAESWQTFSMDFMLPFPQVDQVKLAIGFDHGAGRDGNDTEFFIDDLSLVRIEPPATQAVTELVRTPVETGLLPIGGRWFYRPAAGETAVPKRFDASNVDRLLYHDDGYSAPFAGNTTAWLRAGNKGLDGTIVRQDRLVTDNVTIEFDKTSMKIHTHGVPNHPTGLFPEPGFGNPGYIQEREATYFIPLNPSENPRHAATKKDNSNHALHMGPIGIATNGVVFFNPFDMGNQDAADMMDRCCGHPNQDNQYHYHKYPICANSPWADEGKGHSPVIGWAFDGYPVYGPYENANEMAKDVKGSGGLNEFNAHFDAVRGWHYHATPGVFPYLIGGFWGVEDKRDGGHRPPRGGNGPPDFDPLGIGP